MRTPRPLTYLIGLQALDDGLRALSNPIHVTLTIGNDSGEAQIQGKFT